MAKRNIVSRGCVGQGLGRIGSKARLKTNCSKLHKRLKPSIYALVQVEPINYVEECHEQKLAR